MLKFLRKYNLIILVVGGSLLMVVFLLQPVLTRLQPSPASRKVGTIGPDNKKVTQGDFQQASDDLRVIESIAPFIPRAGLGLQPNREMAHYYLLLHEAQRAGVVGGVDDGASWIPELATEQARIDEISQYPRQYWNMIASQPFFAQAVAQRAIQLEPQLMERREQLAGRLGIPVARVDQALANARGIFRLRTSYTSTLRLSAPDTLELAHERFDAALADLLVVPASRFESEIPAPTDAQLAAHFEAYKAEIPGTGEFGFGYLQPASVKLEWLILDPAAFNAAVDPDPIEVRKRWTQNRATYTRDFADERARIETELRAQEAERLMVEADGVIRREVLAKTRQLETDDSGHLVVPADWDQRRPRMSDIALRLVADLEASEGVRVPMPRVESREAGWLNAQDLSTIPELGRASFRVGATPIPAPLLPLIVRENETGQRSPLNPQVGVPIVETPATDDTGRRFYVTILAARRESPPDTLDDVRAQLTADLTSKLAYDKLLAEATRYAQLAREEGLPAVAAMLAPSEGAAPHTVDTDVLLTRLSATPLVAPELSDPRVRQATDFLEAAVDAAAQRLDPVAPIGASPLDESIVWGAAPLERLVVLARLTAYRPVTIEDFRLRSRALVRAEASQLLAEATEADEVNPFSFDALSSRANFIVESDKDDEPAEDDDATEGDPAQG